MVIGLTGLRLWVYHAFCSLVLDYPGAIVPSDYYSWPIGSLAQ